MATEPHAAIVDEHGHALGCPAYNQPTFTLCTCGAAERAGLDVKFSTEKTGDAARKFECPHIRPWTIKWGIASDKKWCSTCKTWVYADIDWDGHP